jgi:tRNA (adenine57-N1/adenine58-N1)-methyltransferase
LPELKRRASKSDYSDDDVEAWTPGALGERVVSQKSLRKRVREASESARLARERDAADGLDDRQFPPDAVD